MSASFTKEEIALRREQNRTEWRQRNVLVERFVLAAVCHHPGMLDELGLYAILGDQGYTLYLLTRVVKTLVKNGVLTRRMYRDERNRPISGLLLTNRAEEMFGAGRTEGKNQGG